MNRAIIALEQVRGCARPGVQAAAGERIVAAREEERNRLYYDLHDGLGPILASIRLRLDAVAVEVDHLPEARQMIVDTTAETARILDEVRRIVDDLRPPELEVGLPEALRMLGRRMGRRVPTGTSVLPELRVDAAEINGQVHPSTAVAAYRIAAEGLNNAVRHASATQVTVRLRSSDTYLRLEIVDDGVGLRPATPRGVGLSSMARRAAEVGGSSEVLLRPDGRSGTLVRAVLPHLPR